MTVVEFLLARFEGDWGEAQYVLNLMARDDRPALFGSLVTAIEHTARSVLTDAEAKRRIVEHETAVDRPKLGAPPYVGPLNDPDSDEPRRHPQLVAYLEQWGEQVIDTPILRILAQSYADHPDFDPAWSAAT